MYPLTDFSKEKLRLLAELIQSRLTHEEACLKINDETSDDILGVKETLGKQYAATIQDLKEMNVWVLTALNVVKAEGIVTSN